ncbi:MAG: oleate hydratase, partial [Galactobacter sp.]
MEHTAGNYEAFARPRPARHAQETKAYIVGSGLAGLAAAVFLIRDAGVPGANVTILEKGETAGGALDGLDVPEKGFVIRGGRELENHME